MRQLALLSLLLTAFGCKHAPKASATDPPKSSVTASANVSSAKLPVPPGSAADPSPPDAVRPPSNTPGLDSKRYRWLGAGNLKFPAPVDSVEARFPAPPGYTRVPVAPGSFSEWLRGLPLAAEGSPVLSHAGDTVYPGDDTYVAAVVAIDVGPGDLQQSADAVIRLHAEWLWANDKLETITYRSATRLDMPFSRWIKGQRLLASGPNVFWVVKGKPRTPTYDDFRQYIDAAMLWSNNISLAARASKVADPKELSAGDFFLQSRGKGHAVLVVDIAQKPTGERVALLARALQSPAQSIHILRPGRATAWFSMRPPSPLLTPRSDEFSWGDLERLEPKKEE